MCVFFFNSFFTFVLGLCQRPKIRVQFVSNLWICFSFIGGEGIVVENMGPQGRETFFFFSLCCFVFLSPPYLTFNSQILLIQT